jgi:hypothetical protein
MWGGHRAAAADTEQLPFDANYDPAALEAYYSKRPLQLYSRVAFVTRNALTIAVAWARDEWLPSAEGVTRGKVLRDTIATMGPVFVKLGQTLSTRPDIIGQEACDACGQLQDQMPPFNSTQAFDILSRELQWAGPICPEDKRPGLDATVGPLFRQLTTEPVSAASLGQVGVTRPRLSVASWRARSLSASPHPLPHLSPTLAPTAVGPAVGSCEGAADGAEPGATDTGTCTGSLRR